MECAILRGISDAGIIPCKSKRIDTLMNIMIVYKRAHCIGYPFAKIKE